MKIQNLLEAQFVPTIYAYHVTKAENLRSILKNGLIPNHRSDGYSSEDMNYAFKYPLSPLKGIYLTKNKKEAEFISDSIDKHIIVVCKVQNRTAFMDEDNIEKYFSSGELKTILKRNLSDEELLDQSSEYCLRKLESSGLGKRNLERITPALQNYLKSLIEILHKRHEDDDHSLKNRIQNVKMAQETLTRQLKNILFYDPLKNKTFRIDSPIGYSGANKIVGFVNTEDNIGYGDVGDFKNEIHHYVKYPIELTQNV